MYILISVEINMYCVSEKGGNHCVHFERDGYQNQCVRWRSIYSFCGNGNSHRNQRGDLARLVDVDNVWGAKYFDKYLDFKNNHCTAR